MSGTLSMKDTHSDRRSARCMSCSTGRGLGKTSTPPNKAMQTDGRFAAAADRQGVIPQCASSRTYRHPEFILKREKA